jgi:hypothetical protein
MSESRYRDKWGNEVVLADSVRESILVKHPEAVDFIDRIGDVLRDPDEIRSSVRAENSVLYYRYQSDVLDGKWVVVVVKRIDRHFISTLYATHHIKSGEVLWTKNT